MVNQQSLNELALFAGAGGGILGGHLLGWRTVCAVEWEQYPASVLCARQNDKILPPFPIWDDVQTFDGKPWRGIVDVVSGGFPCQDISAAGGGAGITGERSGMWKHMARIIGEVRPRYVFVENSPMLTTRGLGVVLADLSQMGFDAKWGVVSAADVGAPHLRERIWILATDTSFQRCNEWGGDWKERQLLHDINRDASESKPERERWQRGIGEIGSDVANSCDKGLQGSKQFQNDIGENIRGQTIPHGSITKRNNDEGTSSNWWDIEPNVGRVADGVAARVDRLKAIGNGQVPLCAATAWELLK